ncbi:MAG: peptidoglycan-binding protein [Devosia sp.]|uniref:peptidoglycan-binding domain-containing protein n=1 Tax=Devosia sp. TaxID=1871048 RepID=UPI0019E611D7|nr:peptidoglycan-binding protein [Devosia sp.]
MISGNVNRWGVACLLLISLYFASTSAPRADFELSRGWFGELGDEDRVALQTDLTLAGFYDAIIDGAFGPSTYRALTAFQKWNGDTATGVLDGTAMRALSRAAQSVFEELGLEIVHDEGGKLEIAVPRALLPDTSRTSVGTAYTRPDGFMRLDTVRSC